MKLTSNKIFSFMLAAAFALTLAGCGGGGGGAAMDDDMEMVTPEPTLTPEEMCAEENGRFEDDGMCTSAEDVAAEIADKKADATKSANTKTMAINAEGMQTDDAGAGGDNAADIAIAHKDGAVSIAVSRGMGDDKVDFAKMADLTGADDSTGSMNVLGPNDDGETEIAIVYTDIDPPKPTKFGAEGTGVTLNVRKDGESPTTDDPADSMSVEAGTDEVNLPKIMAGGFSAATGGSATVTHNFLPEMDDDAGTTDMDESRDAAEVMGSFDGAMGTYTCNTGDGGNDCTVTVDDEGEVTGISTGWIFTPASVADGGTIDVDDNDYLHYGVWLMKTAQDDGSDEYNEVQTFAMSSLDAATNVSSVEGTASYKGGAAGVYVRDVYNSDRTQESATSGHFTASVNLMAYFGGDDVAVNKKNSIEGTIDNFTLSGGEDASGWGAKVEAAIANNAATGTAKGGGAGDGSFSANFHGDDTNDAGDDIGPKALVGEFNAEFTNGSVAGGFGARRQ